MTVDEILGNGTYTDRRGRDWATLGNAWVLLDPWRWPNKPKRESMTANEMRLLIERDQHRGECQGLMLCFTDHPRVRVEIGDGYYFTYEPFGGAFVGMYDALAEAMDAARALAVGE